MTSTVKYTLVGEVFMSKDTSRTVVLAVVQRINQTQTEKSYGL